MTLTRRDLDLIREIVRSEIERLGHPASPSQQSAPDDAEDEDPEIARQVNELFERMHREGRERAARPIPKDVVDLYDAARLSGVVMDTVAGWVRRGLLPGRKVKGHVQIDRSELESFLAERRRR